MTQTSSTLTPQIERVAKALHGFEREHGYIAREWNGAGTEDVYCAMARTAIEAAGALDKPGLAWSRNDVCKAAGAASKAFGQWVPQRWLELFMETYESNR